MIGKLAVLLLAAAVLVAGETSLEHDPGFDALLEVMAGADDLSSSTPTGIVQEAKTATGDPVLSANANEIVNIHDTNGHADPELDEGAEAEKELQITLKLQRKRRQERLEKHNQEQMFKSREQETKDDAAQRQREQFNEHLEKKKEESAKTVSEEEAKGDAKYELKTKLAEEKKDLKIKTYKRKAEAAKAQIDAKKKAFEVRAELETRQLREEEAKSKARTMAFAQEQSRKKQRRKLRNMHRAEANSKQHRLLMAQETDRKATTEKRDKARVKREEANKRQDREVSNKDYQNKRAAKREHEFKQEQRELMARKKAREAERKGAERDTKQEERAQKQHERNRKNSERNLKRQAEADKKAAMRRNEANRKNAHAKWCHCENFAFGSMGGNNRWYNCPGNSLFVGLHRHNGGIGVDRITHFRCCQACRPDNSVLRLTGCNNANWVHSFDSRGWSYCPRGSYIQGLYKSSCNWIYCLEYARCCSLAGSSGWKTCNAQTRWARELDYGGWKYVDGNYFIGGLYRNTCKYLYCIEYAHQCLARAY